MRGFFAFGVAEDFSENLDNVVREIPSGSHFSKLHPADYHVTIKFLSEFSSTDFFHCLADLCALGPAPENSLQAGMLSLWPTVLALECEPTPELRLWHRQVNSILEKKGFLKERHPEFRPHITIARVKLGRKLPEIESFLAVEAEKFAGQAVPVTEPMLWRSQAEETGRRHQPLLSLLFPANQSFQR